MCTWFSCGVQYFTPEHKNPHKPYMHTCYQPPFNIEWAQEANSALIILLSQQKALQEKLTDLESRSKRNNLRIYGVAEGVEGESAAKFVLELLRRELLTSKFKERIGHSHRILQAEPSRDPSL